MFLNQLDLQEKKAFLELAHLVAKADGIISEDEEKLLLTYLHEMDLNNSNYELKNVPLTAVISEFKSEQSKNIVFVEILGLIFADGSYQEEERDIVKAIKNEFGFSPDKYEQCKAWVQKINAVYNEGLQLIYG